MARRAVRMLAAEDTVQTTPAPVARARIPAAQALGPAVLARERVVRARAVRRRARAARQVAARGERPAVGVEALAARVDSLAWDLADAEAAPAPVEDQAGEQVEAAEARSLTPRARSRVRSTEW